MVVNFVLFVLWKKAQIKQCYLLLNLFLVFSDKHPLVASLNETPVHRKACVLEFDEPCIIEEDVLIRKCGEEVQYYLKSSFIYSAYCFGKCFI